MFQPGRNMKTKMYVMSLIVVLTLISAYGESNEITPVESKSDSLVISNSPKKKQVQKEEETEVRIPKETSNWALIKGMFM